MDNIQGTFPSCGIVMGHPMFQVYILIIITFLKIYPKSAYSYKLLCYIYLNCYQQSLPLGKLPKNKIVVNLKSPPCQWRTRWTT